MTPLSGDEVVLGAELHEGLGGAGQRVHVDAAARERPCAFEQAPGLANPPLFERCARCPGDFTGLGRGGMLTFDSNRETLRTRIWPAE